MSGLEVAADGGGVAKVIELVPNQLTTRKMLMDRGLVDVERFRLVPLFGEE